MVKKFDIHRDELKERHTSHWDWDFMSAQEYELEMTRLRDARREAARARRGRLVRFGAAAVVVASVAAGAVIGLS